MRYFTARIAENRSLGGGYFVIRLRDCESLGAAKPGQFVMIRGDWERDPLLPRAFSLMSVGPEGRADILAKTVGRGTALLERALPGARMSVLGPLGSTFPEPRPDALDLLVAGGVGLPPIYMQAELAAQRGLVGQCEVLYGGRGAPDLVLLAEMRAMGATLSLTTEDGAVGTKGLVTAALEARLAQHRGRAIRIMGCGPNAMLWAVARIAKAREVPCFISLEEQMACGIGVCLGCAIPARSRPFRYVCSNGPVFDAADVLDVKP
jgi:dihydroorotate dehydrogenase electron transfer subunit